MKSVWVKSVYYILLPVVRWNFLPFFLLFLFHTMIYRDKQRQNKPVLRICISYYISSIYANSVTNNMHEILSELYVFICIWLNIWTVHYWFVFPGWISNHKTHLNASLRSNNINNFRPFIFILSRHPSFSMWTFAGKKKSKGIVQYLPFYCLVNSYILDLTEWTVLEINQLWSMGEICLFYKYGLIRT